MMTKNKIKEVWLIIYVFVYIFEPPFLPISFIYINLCLTIFLIILEEKGKIDVGIIRQSGLNIFIKMILIMLIYLLIVNGIDILFVEKINLLSNRLKVINQLVVLTGQQILAVYYILKKCRDYNYTLDNVFDIIIKCGVLQGICSLLAYLISPIRSFFFRYAGDLYRNSYVLERRAYGYSSILVDTFGFGMGLIAGFVLLKSNYKTLSKIICLIIIGFSILVNARTGIIVMIVAFAMLSFKANSPLRASIKVLIYGIIAILLYIYILPSIISAALKSNNITLNWIAYSINQIYESMNNQGSVDSISQYSFLSDFIALPDNSFEFLFGSGHTMYGTANSLGMATDVGYINLFWTYGIIGGCLILLVYFFVFYKAYRISRLKQHKLTIIFVAICYYLVLLKAILLGYNPGTAVMYLCICSILYYKNNQNSSYTFKKVKD